ncbi:hypothetical protein DUNSADRAFT_2680 [Dunaliella salina]|uniref:Uncharacterized protein n=1 Tax=Dunaliella salina TaxID=3046 RepID=A0ABQ7H883_DUNSA|nr:hypothetical protein DUNSADRAFT_2680 [Dunaliella salina]|eukprot:KAF5843067.1 hypothetical protein DUNSADRAFT_2680 [Dunaliella salina]
MDKSCPTEDRAQKEPAPNELLQNPSGHQDGQLAAPFGTSKEATATEPSAGQSSGAGGGLGGLPRPPPLTIPAGANAQSAAVAGMSPLPSALALASPGMLNLDSLLSGGHHHSQLTASSPGLQTLFNQMAHSSRGGIPGPTIGSAGLGGLGARDQAQDAAFVTPSAPHGKRAPQLFKGVNFDKGRHIWQLLLLDSNSHQVIAEYGSELEALVAQELLTPAPGLGITCAQTLCAHLPLAHCSSAITIAHSVPGDMSVTSAQTLCAPLPS